MTAQERKEHPLAAGVLAYFPDALMEVAHCSYVGNEQHNPGEPLHWAKEKSKDERDALMRHLKDDLLDPGCLDDDGVRHAAKVAWRALANLQRIIDAEKESEKRSFPAGHLDQCPDYAIGFPVDIEQQRAAEQAMAAIRSSRDYISVQDQKRREDAVAESNRKRSEELDRHLEEHLEARRKLLDHGGVGEGDAGLPPLPTSD